MIFHDLDGSPLTYLHTIAYSWSDAATDAAPTDSAYRRPTMPTTATGFDHQLRTVAQALPPIKGLNPSKRWIIDVYQAADWGMSLDEFKAQLITNRMRTGLARCDSPELHDRDKIAASKTHYCGWFHLINLDG
jgi:hypothetical protein